MRPDDLAIQLYALLSLAESQCQNDTEHRSFCTASHQLEESRLLYRLAAAWVLQRGCPQH